MNSEEDAFIILLKIKTYKLQHEGVGDIMFWYDMLRF